MTKHSTHKKIVLYNHKGGVGKTTLTVNIAAALGYLKKKVLLVDSDPQCNLTSYLIEDSVVDDLLDRSDEDTGQTLWSALKPIVEATGEAKKVKPIEVRDNLLLLPGDIRLSEYEINLIDFWADCWQRRTKGFRGVTALSSLVERTAQKYEIDYVFYDAGPNIGPLNKIILLDCDCFIVPAACDFFSIRALKTMGHSLATWIKDWETISRLAPDGIDLLNGKPRLLGYIPQRFRVYGGQLTTGYARYLSKIEKGINNDIVSRMHKVMPTLAHEISGDLRLGLIKDFGTLANAAQTQGLPMWEVDAGTQLQRDEAKDVFLEIAKKIIAKID